MKALHDLQFFLHPCLFGSCVAGARQEHHIIHPHYSIKRISCLFSKQVQKHKSTSGCGITFPSLAFLHVIYTNEIFPAWALLSRDESSESFCLYEQFPVNVSDQSWKQLRCIHRYTFTITFYFSDPATHLLHVVFFPHPHLVNLSHIQFGCEQTDLEPHTVALSSFIRAAWRLPTHFIFQNTMFFGAEGISLR